MKISQVEQILKEMREMHGDLHIKICEAGSAEGGRDHVPLGDGTLIRMFAGGIKLKVGEDKGKFQMMVYEWIEGDGRNTWSSYKRDT